MKQLILILATLLVAVTAQALEAGAAKADITPPLGTPLNGYGDRMGRGALAVMDPLWARCLFLDDGETSVFIINSDLCFINAELRARVLELAPAEVPRENIILTATHTHSAQGAMVHGLPFRAITGRFMPEVLEATAQGFAQAMKDALAAKKRATIGYTAFEQEDLSRNRQVKDGPIDKQVGVIRVDDSDGNMISLVANLAAHPTSISGKDFMSISADYPGFYYLEAEKLGGEGCTALFLNGAQGNQTIHGPETPEGFQRTEAVGRVLARRSYEAAQTIEMNEATIHVGYAEPMLPPRIGDKLLPETTVLHTLEIGDLLLTFFPGEPCVQIGLDLRQRAKARGYGNHFSVGLGSDYILYFVPRELYGSGTYEAAMNGYGPRIENWFYREFSELMTRGAAEPVPEPPAAATIETAGAASFLRLGGSSHDIGYRRGAAMSEAVADAYERRIREPLESGELYPDTGIWGMLPGFIDPTPLTLPFLANSMKPLTAGVSDAVFEEIEGMADGAGLPFDAVWMTQCAGLLTEGGSNGELFSSPFCTMVAAVGDRAGADEVIVGRNLDWPTYEQPVVMEIVPKEGHRILHVGFPWNVGVFTGMNDAGLVACIERVEAQGALSMDGPPVELVVRQVLQECATMDEAIAVFDAHPHIRGVHVLIADAATPGARVIEFGRNRLVREVGEDQDLLLGVEPGQADGATTIRYNRLKQLIESERILAGLELAAMLSDAEPNRTGREQIFNEDTRHSVVFAPKARRMHVSVPDEDGRWTQPVEIGFEGAAP